jgi:hypothetical protein
MAECQEKKHANNSGVKKLKILTLFYILNASLLLLHEIESAYEKEWEILNLPGKITGFLLLHIPILILLFYGLIEIEKQTMSGLIIGLITGVGGLIPFAVHKIIVKREDHFNKPISNIVMYSSIITGVGTTVLCARLIV